MKACVVFCIILMLCGCSKTVESVEDITASSLSGVLGDYDTGLFITDGGNALRYWIIPVEGIVLTVHVKSSYGVMLPANWAYWDNGVAVYRTGNANDTTPYLVTYIKNP